MSKKGGSTTIAAAPTIDPNMVSNMQAQNQMMMDSYQQQMQMIMQQSLAQQQSLASAYQPVVPQVQTYTPQTIYQAAPVDPIIITPEYQEIETIDWESKIAELNNISAQAESQVQEKKKTLTDTILTSPLLEDEEETTTQLSLLGR